MLYDRQIAITVGTNRHSKQWRGEITTVSQLFLRLSQPIISTETYAEYMNLPKAGQDDLKDVGGFVGGTLNGTRRKAANVTGRDIITLDLDSIPDRGADGITARTEALNCCYCIYSTRKHIPAKPRLRIIIPLDRTVSADEYEPIARRLAQQIGIECADKTTFDVSRLMYFPSKCADTEFYFRQKDAPFISADMVLGTYADWHDVGAWPRVPGEGRAASRQMTKQGDPLEKAGTVGAFCRTYTIEAAMDKFLPGVYEPVENASDRYTYTGGSTTGGAVVYDGKFLYSHHATDPCGEKLVNAFDMVRLHKFGDLDEDKPRDTPAAKLPSFLRMCEFAAEDKECKTTIARERREQAAAEFAGIAAEADMSCVHAEDYEWETSLATKANGEIKSTINNFVIIMENDPAIKGKFGFNDFSGRVDIFGALPWKAETERRIWTDTDTNGLYWYIENRYGAKSRGDIDSAFSIVSAKHRFNEVRDYINSLEWDGVKRLDTLFIDYLGAENTPYTRTVTRKMFIAGIKRAMEPGCKFDEMLILVGPQGLGKSTILGKMSNGWFNDSICTFEGKEAAELIQGVWLIEISELGAFNRSDTKRIKQFLSLRSDYFRAAYARTAEERKRKCVFFGTTNDDEFLRDPTGERRYWPVDCNKERQTKSPFTDLTETTVKQIWAEAKAYWIAGEPLYLSGEMAREAWKKQREHKEVSAREGLIREFVERRVPADWQKYSIDRRRMYWSAERTGKAEADLVERDRISAVEIWVECLGGDPKYMKQSDAREINGVLKNLEGWNHDSAIVRCGAYGRQRGFTKNK